VHSLFWISHHLCTILVWYCICEGRLLSSSFAPIIKRKYPYSMPGTVCILWT
jgi:hypothetical protein